MRRKFSDTYSYYSSFDYFNKRLYESYICNKYKAYYYINRNHQTAYGNIFGLQLKKSPSNSLFEAAPYKIISLNAGFKFL